MRNFAIGHFSIVHLMDSIESQLRTLPPPMGAERIPMRRKHTRKRRNPYVQMRKPTERNYRQGKGAEREGAERENTDESGYLRVPGGAGRCWELWGRFGFSKSTPKTSTETWTNALEPESSTFRQIRPPFGLKRLKMMSFSISHPKPRTAISPHAKCIRAALITMQPLKRPYDRFRQKFRQNF